MTTYRCIDGRYKKKKKITRTHRQLIHVIDILSRFLIRSAHYVFVCLSLVARLARRICCTAAYIQENNNKNILQYIDGVDGVLSPSLSCTNNVRRWFSRVLRVDVLKICSFEPQSIPLDQDSELHRVFPLNYLIRVVGHVASDRHLYIYIVHPRTAPTTQRPSSVYSPLAFRLRLLKKRRRKNNNKPNTLTRLNY